MQKETKSYIVFSDIHGDYKNLKKIKTLIEENDGGFFAGDGLSGVLSSSLKNLYWVAGNCDGYGEKERIVEIDGVKILLTHGHLYSVKQGMEKLYFRAKEVGANVVIFGHTHMPTIVQSDEILFLNPGSSSSLSYTPTFIYMCVTNGSVKAFLNETTLSL